MVQSSGKRGDTPRTLFKIILMLGLALAGVAAIAAEPPPAACAETEFAFGGRIVENGEATDTWTLTCWRQPAAQAAVPSTAAVVKPVETKPVDATTVATQPSRQTSMTPPGEAQF
ncbi:MAG: hypothetical protein JWO51_3392 [Rhodospirillales bacterium]|nr:hypothetical protein [Rhodospirillales bacterium]